jgi:hypothetical protein
VRAEVRDDGSGFDPGRPRFEFSKGGAGLVLVDELSDRWGVRPGSTTVWFELGVAT